MHCDPETLLRRGVAAFLAVTLLVVGFTGRAGVQVLDGAAAARIAEVHRHGVPGEAEHIHSHGTWRGFVPDHCHGSIPTIDGQPSPDEVQAASALAGSILCAAMDWSMPSAPVALAHEVHAAQLPDGLAIRPPVPPPQG